MENEEPEGESREEQSIYEEQGDEDDDRCAEKEKTCHDINKPKNVVIRIRSQQQYHVARDVQDGEDEDEVEDEDDSDEGFVWGEHMQKLAAQSKEETRREATEERVRFAAVAVQWHERQRQTREEFEKRFGKVCGRNYDGEGPRIVDEKGKLIKTISDSGTNIDVMSYWTAQYLHQCGLVFRKCREDEPKRYIVFGKESARELILGYMQGQGLLGKVAVVNNIAANLISVTAFTQRGMLVTYSASQVEIRRASDNEIVFVGPYDATTGLYHLDLIHLMLAPGLGEQGKGQAQKSAQQGTSFAASAQAAPATATTTAPSAAAEAEAGAEEAEDGQDQPIFKQAALHRGRLFHENMEHVPYSTIADNIESGTWTGLHPDLTPALMRELARRHDCIICGVSRWNQEHPKGSGDDNYPVGHTVALDYQGKISPTSKNGETGEFVLTDIGSGFTKRYGERNDKTTVKDALKEWCAFFLSFGHIVREARHDSGAVEVGEQFKKAARELGVNPIPTAPGDPEKRIERRIQTHKMDIAGILARTRLLNTNDWDIASSHACLIRSTMRCAQSKLKGDGTKSPYELVTGKKPRIDVFQKYGLGDIGVVKKAEAKKPGYGGHKNEAVQIIGMEVGDVKAVRVEFIETRTRARRGGVQKLYLRSTELSDEEQAARKATFTDNQDGSLTFAIEGGGDVVVESVRQLQAQEMELAKRSSAEEFETVAQRMQLRRDQQRKEAEEAEAEENEQSAGDAQAQDGRGDYWYWGREHDDDVPNMAFWVSHLEVRGMPAEEYARDVYHWSFPLTLFGGNWSKKRGVKLLQSVLLRYSENSYPTCYSFLPLMP